MGRRSVAPAAGATRATWRAEVMQELRAPVRSSLGNLLLSVAATFLLGVGSAVHFLSLPGDTSRWSPLLRFAWALPWFLAGYALLRLSSRFTPPPRRPTGYTVNLCPSCTEHANDPAHDWLEA